MTLCVAVGQFSCSLANPCTYDNIMTYGYYFPHYDLTRYIQCGFWDPFELFASCRELHCRPGSVWDQINGYCNDPSNVGSSNESCLCC